MPNFKVIISIVILIAALFLLFDKLFTPQPIQITLESGQEITTSTSEYFSIEGILLSIICAFLIGATATYLFYNSDQIKKINTSSHATESNTNIYNTIIPLLKADEKRVITILRESNGEIQQNQLVTKLGLSKVKITRILYGLEQKKLITKERYGFTNMVRLKRQ